MAGQIILWVCIGLNVVTLIINLRNLAKLKAARESAIRACEVYSKALEELILAENENIHTEKEGE